MRTDLLLVALIVGGGTWLFRFLPTRLQRRSQARDGRLAHSLESIGPAAIATLFVASVLPDLVATAAHRPLVLVGSAVTVLAFLSKRNVILATLAGAAAYGAAHGLLLGG
jgi:branched-subunit amino acid transport protein